MDRVALAGKLFSGKSTLAEELERRGWFRIDFVRVLKQIVADALQPYHPGLTVEDMEEHKEYYRQLYIEFAKVIGFAWHPGFVNIALQPWWQAGMPTPVVFEPPRWDEQFAALQPYGFELVYLDFFTPPGELHPEHIRRAKQKGVGVRELRKKLADPTENGLTGEALHLDATWTTSELADMIERGTTVIFPQEEAV